MTHSYLTDVVRLMLANVEPFAKSVGRPPRPFFIHGHKPLIIALRNSANDFSRVSCWMSK